MRKAEVIVASARMLVGTPFRPQGHDPARGLDCIGLAAVACGVPSEALQDDYRLSGKGQGGRLCDALPKHFRRVSRASLRAGDLLLLRPGRGQWHLAISTGTGFVHADVRRRTVVETPGEPGWPIAAVYRLRSRKGR